MHVLLVNIDRSRINKSDIPLLSAFLDLIKQYHGKTGMIWCHLRFFEIPIFRTNFHFPWRFEKSEFHCILKTVWSSFPGAVFLANMIIGVNFSFELNWSPMVGVKWLLNEFRQDYRVYVTNTVVFFLLPVWFWTRVHGLNSLCRLETTESLESSQWSHIFVSGRLGTKMLLWLCHWF